MFEATHLCYNALNKTGIIGVPTLPDALPKGIKADEVIKAFEKAGGSKRPGKGSHVNIKMPNGQLITIPYYGDVKSGLLQAAIKKAGLTIEQFKKLIGR